MLNDPIQQACREVNAILDIEEVNARFVKKNLLLLFRNVLLGIAIDFFRGHVFELLLIVVRVLNDPLLPAPCLPWSNNPFHHFP